MENLIKLIVEHIVAKPDKVDVTHDQEDNTIHFRITADKDDLGKIIGKNGKTIAAIRTLVKTVAATDHSWITIDVDEA